MKWEIKQFNSLVSTNTTAREYPAGTIVMAETQTGGRGRYGRIWQSPRGNLYVSFVFESNPMRDQYLSFLTGLALAESLPEFNVRLKWPNDVLLEGKKVAGILLENAGDKIIVGIGVNLVNNPDKNMLYPTANLGGRLSPIGLVKRLMIQYEALFAVFEKKGFNKIRARWLDLATGVGETISVHLPTEELIGTFHGISDEGALLLKTGKKVRSITAGDVFLI
ncbi:MAG: biotin--[Alphaproteobacteria bacterium]|nr:biotin--[acetyl-CoA-carboxylase] ligase [Alphaproteobacteria bacterium]